MKRRPGKLQIAGVMLVAVLFTGIAVSRVAAQPAINPIAMAFQELQNAITGLQTTVNNVQTIVQGLAASEETNVRSSPPIFLDDFGSLICTASNVSNAPRRIKAEIVQGFEGKVVAELMTGVTPFQPGEARGGSGGPPVRDVYYCKFTVLDGVKSDIRAAAERLSGGPRLIVAAE